MAGLCGTQCHQLSHASRRRGEANGTQTNTRRWMLTPRSSTSFMVVTGTVIDVGPPLKKEKRTEEEMK